MADLGFIDVDAEFEKYLKNKKCLNYLGRVARWLKSNIYLLNWEGFKKVLQRVKKNIASVVVDVSIFSIAVIFIHWLHSFPVVSSAISFILSKLQTGFEKSWEFFVNNRERIRNMVSAIYTQNTAEDEESI